MDDRKGLAGGSLGPSGAGLSIGMLVKFRAGVGSCTYLGRGEHGGNGDGDGDDIGEGFE